MDLRSLKKSLSKAVDTIGKADFGEKASEWIKLWDDDLVDALSEQSSSEEDQRETIDNGAYDQRLRRLLKNVKSVNGKPLDVKVYISEEVNAFAYSNNVVRVYSGLMDHLKDNELIAIIGHEIGHIVHHDTRKKMRYELAVSIGRDVLESMPYGQLLPELMGKVTENYLNSRYSRKAEEKADDYGYEFAISQGYSPASMADALDVFVRLEEGEQSSLIERMFASHPDSKDRADRLRAIGDKRIRQLNGDY